MLRKAKSVTEKEWENARKEYEENERMSVKDVAKKLRIPYYSARYRIALENWRPKKPIAEPLKIVATKKDTKANVQLTQIKAALHAYNVVIEGLTLVKSRYSNTDDMSTDDLAKLANATKSYVDAMGKASETLSKSTIDCNDRKVREFLGEDQISQMERLRGVSRENGSVESNNR